MPEPITLAVAAEETAKVAVKEAAETAIKETSEAAIKDVAIKESLPTIENTSLESLKAQNEMAIQEAKIQQLENNRVDGANRELKANNDLQKEFPESEGYKIHQEAYLRNSDGYIVKDILSDEARRVDFMVEKEGQIVKSIEVTSETAPKEIQISKETQIRDSGGNFIKDRESGSLIKIPDNVKTEIRRYA